MLSYGESVKMNYDKNMYNFFVAHKSEHSDGSLHLLNCMLSERQIGDLFTYTCCLFLTQLTHLA